MPYLLQKYLYFPDAVHEIFAMAMLVRITFAASTNITFQYTAELFPTEVRGRGLSLQRMFGGIGSCLAPTVVFLVRFLRNQAIFKKSLK